MPKPSAISVFVAATSLLVTSAGVPALQANDAGGLKVWNTVQDLNEESVLDADAAALKKRLSKRISVFRLVKAKTAGEYFRDY